MSQKENKNLDQKIEQVDEIKNESTVKKLDELSREEILNLPIFKVVVSKKENMQYKTTSVEAEIYLSETHSISTKLDLVDYELIKYQVKMTPQVKNVINNKKQITSVIESLTFSCPCRFFKGVSQATEKTYYRIQVLVYYKKDDENNIVISFWMRNKDFKLFNIKQNLGEAQKVEWLGFNNQEELKKLDEEFDESDRY